MTKAVYPGTFDPPTNGHIDIIYRAIKIFDKLIVGITDGNISKNHTFTLQERKKMLEQIIQNKNIEIDIFEGLLVNYVKSVKANTIIRGLRAVSDFEYEFQMVLTNRRLNNNIETVFFIPDEKYTYLSSSLIKEIVQLGGSNNLKGFVPDVVIKALIDKYKK